MQFLRIYGLRRECASVSKCQNSLTGEDAALDVNDASFCAIVLGLMSIGRDRNAREEALCVSVTPSSVLFPFQVLFILASI
jgi:hypothetical protein